MKKPIMNSEGVRKVVEERKQREAKLRKPIQIKKKEPVKVPCSEVLVDKLVKNIE